MPNWVFNTVVVSGEQSELDKMVAQLNQPITKNFPDTKWNKDTESWENTPNVQVFNNPVFSFWNVVAPTNIEAYYGEEVHKNNVPMQDNGKIDGAEFMKEFVRAMSEDNDWYHWNVRNWGTKWDIAVPDGEQYANTEMSITDSGEVMYRFETAWSPVYEVLTELSKMYPTLTFDYEYEEEQGWGGNATIIAGDVSITKEWDIPESHADEISLKDYCYHCDDYADADITKLTLEQLQDALGSMYEDCPPYAKFDSAIEIFEMITS